MLTRFALVAIFAAVVLLIALAVRAYARRRTAAVLEADLPGELSVRVPERQAAIVYFFGTHCHECTQQSAILKRLASELNLPVVRINAIEEQRLAEQMGVLTVPSTVVLDAARHVRAVNLGFRSHAVLAQQLAECAAAA